jgi:hypothetical protein
MARWTRNDLFLAIAIVLAGAFLVGYVRRPVCRQTVMVERDVDRATHAVTLRFIPARSGEHGCRVPFFGQ